MTEQQHTPSSKSPDETVEERVLDRFTQEALLDAESLKALRGKLAAGALKPEDWKLALENAIEREARTK